MRETRSTWMWPDWLSSTPASSRPSPAVFGTEPDGEQRVRALDGAAVDERHDDAVGGALDGGRPRLVEHLHAALAEDVLDDGGGVGVLAGQHPVAGRDEDDLRAEAEVGLGELGAGDAGPDDDEVLGQLVEGVDLLPGEDALAVGLRIVSMTRGAAPVATSDDVGVERRASVPSASVGDDALAAREPGRCRAATVTPTCSRLRRMSSLCAAASARIRPLTVCGWATASDDLVAVVVLQPHAEVARPSRSRTCSRRSR